MFHVFPSNVTCKREETCCQHLPTWAPGQVSAYFGAFLFRYFFPSCEIQASGKIGRLGSPTGSIFWMFIDSSSFFPIRFYQSPHISTQGENLMFPPGCSPKFPRGLLRLISKKGEGTFSEVLKARDLARRHSWDGRTKHDFCAASWNFAWDTRSVASQNWLTDWNSERFTKLSWSAWWEHPQAQSIKSGKHVAIKCAYLSWWDGAWQRLCNGLVQWDGSEMSEAWRTTSTASTRWTTSGKSRCSMVQPARSHSSHSWAAGNWGQPAFPIISDNFRSIPGTDHWHAH